MFFILLRPNILWAGLGQTSASIDQDHQVFQAKTRTQKMQTYYTVYELKRDGLTLKEFEDKNGKIFALSWVGISHPDLSNLLGEYFYDYQNALVQVRPTPGHRRFGKFQGKNIVIEKSGLMGQSHGRAYLPQAIPKNVSLDEIQ